MKNISFGPYGAIFHIRATWGNKAMYALKEEKRHPNKNFFKLQMELKVLQAASGGTKEQQQHFPVLYDRSKESRSSMFIVMSLLGDSLADIKSQQPKKICRSKSVRVYPNKIIFQHQHRTILRNPNAGSITTPPSFRDCPS